MVAALFFALMLGQSAPSLSMGRHRLEQLRHGALGPQWKTRAAELASYGVETRLVSESLEARDGAWHYTRFIGVSGYARGLVVELTLSDAGSLLDVSTRFPAEAAPTPYDDYVLQTPLRLPLEGAWEVLWGGRTWDDNRHASMSEMRFALDLWQRRGGVSFANTGTRNDDYFAWGQRVVAPAEGVVVAAVDGVPDNVPQRAVPGSVYGNFVVIDHGHREFSLLGHLRQGSVRVRTGQRVTTDAELARVGNSGMSTEPHLHFHVMDGRNWKTAQGLPLVFERVERNGEVVDRVEPKRGDVLRR